MVGELLSIVLFFSVFSPPPANVLSLKEGFFLPQLVLLHSIPFSYAFGATFPQISLVSRPHLFPEPICFSEVPVWFSFQERTES